MGQSLRFILPDSCLARGVGRPGFAEAGCVWGRLVCDVVGDGGIWRVHRLENQLRGGAGSGSGARCWFHVERRD